MTLLSPLTELPEQSQRTTIDHVPTHLSRILVGKAPVSTLQRGSKLHPQRIVGLLCSSLTFPYLYLARNKAPVRGPVFSPRPQADVSPYMGYHLYTSAATPDMHGSLIHHGRPSATIVSRRPVAFRRAFCLQDGEKRNSGSTAESSGTCHS